MPLDDHRIYGHEPEARLPVLLRHSFDRVRFWFTSLRHNSVSGGMRKSHPILNRADWVFDLNRYAAISGGDNAVSQAVPDHLPASKFVFLSGLDGSNLEDK
jgi:hypothetical protein